MKINDYAFGNFLYELRTEKGLSQAQLGSLLGVTNKAVSKWENGSAKPSTKLLAPMAQILGVTVEELFAARRLPKEDQTIRALLVAQRKRYAQRSSVALAALIILPLLLVAFICIVMGFGMPDDVLGPLGAMGFILGFTVALVSYFIYRSNFKRLPDLNPPSDPSTEAKAGKWLTACVWMFLLILCLLPLVYFSLAERFYDLFPANVFLAVGGVVLLLLLGVIIYLIRIMRLLRLGVFGQSPARRASVPWAAHPLWWRILWVVVTVTTPGVVAIQITGLFHGWLWARWISVMIYFPCVLLLVFKDRRQ